jgi:uncharacterized protein (TIGR02246 family)
MRNFIPLICLLFTTYAATAQSKEDIKQIHDIMSRQARDWNRGDIKAFMNGYWESDSLMFVGKSGVTYGYKATYENYVKRYPDRATMGTLKFDYINLSFPQPDVAFLVGKFTLARPEKGDASGFYTLLWKKIRGRWLIVCDHTS